VAGIKEAGAADGEILVGTVGYTAPEYFHGEPPTTRSDIYSLGAIAYELLMDHLPYGRGFANARDVDRLGYVSARQFKSDIPAWVDAALAQAVLKDPQQRTAALSELVEDLRKPNSNLVVKGFVPPQRRSACLIDRARGRPDFFT
jgi:serine/threonine protein kinase